MTDTATPIVVDAPAISYRGEQHTAPKEFRQGTHRAMPPEETFARIRPHFPEVGITRIADITGLDRLGVPVWCSIRPDSRTLAVDSGKGATPIAAATSAAMEALERCVAERFDDVVIRATHTQVARHAGFAPDEHPRLRHALWAPERIQDWTTAWDLGHAREVVVPHVLVALPGPRRALSDAWWAPSSNGLASGNHFPEALCAALYELIERDVTACWQVATQRGTRPLRVDPGTIDGPVIGSLLEHLPSAGTEGELLWCPNEFGIPGFIGYVRDVDVPEAGVCKGYGCHLDPEIAMIRAVTEAVQARTLIIAGARDDIFRSHLRVVRASGAKAGGLVERTSTVGAPSIPDASTPTFHGDVALLVERLRDRGFDRVIVRALPADHLEVAVVRAFVPGLEGYRFPWIDAGDRASAFDPSPWLPAGAATA